MASAGGAAFAIQSTHIGEFDERDLVMCFEINRYPTAKHFVQDLKDNDPKLEILLGRARNDDADALFAGSLVLLGGFDLTPIDEVEATEWTRRGALLKHPACAVAYGLHLNSGYAIGKRRDADRHVVLGKKWLLDSTKDRSQPCALMLRAVVEEQGLGGFRRSKFNAEKLYGLAAELGDPFGQFRLSQHYEAQSNRNGQDDGHARTAFRLARLAAEQGFASAQRMLSIYLQNGFGTDKDPDASVTWLFKAANQHHPSQQSKPGTGAGLKAGKQSRTQMKQIAH